MYCRNCGSKLPDGSVFCSYCGATLKQQNFGKQTPLQNNTQNAPIPENQRPQTYPVAPPKAPKKKSNTTKILLIVSCVVLAVSVIGLVISLVLSGNDDTRAERKQLISRPAENEEDETAASTTEIHVQQATETTAPPTTEPTAPPTTAQEYMNVTFTYDYVDFKVPISGYIIEGSNYRSISESELYGMTEHQCSLARNEIYARHGRQFNSPRVSDYFEHMPWYYGSIPADEFDRNVDFYLNETEKYNLVVIAGYESKMGWK